MNVTLVPAQMVLFNVPMLTLAGSIGLTTIVMPLEVAVWFWFVRQGVALEVITTVTTSPLFRDVVV